MKRILAILFLLAAAVVPAFAQVPDKLQPPPKRNFKYDGKIVTTYDNAKNETLVLIQLMPIKSVEDPHEILEDSAQHPRDWSWLGFTMFFSYPGQSVVTPKGVSLGFLYEALEPKHYEGHVLTAKIDGERVPLGTMEVLKTTIVKRKWDQYTRRTLELIVPYDMLLRLANAKKVKMTLGRFDFDLSKDNLEAIRDLANRTTP
ncbi:MAG TPA: hypothetical protein VGO56_17760 [Pyrinomonadaceae bacterium]|jgi:hypothetical protein|nr:hypothetical protein [Pyrinomonadaceae bacterium]